MSQKRSFQKLKIINVTLVILILFFAYSFYYKTDVQFDCEYGKPADSIISILQRNNPDFSEKKISVIYVSNEYPTDSDIWLLNKINWKYKNNVNVFSLFNKIANKDIIDFPYSVKKRILFKCKKEVIKKYFFVIKDNKIVYSSPFLELFNVSFQIQKILYPEKSYKDYVLDTNELINKVIERMRKGVFRLFNPQTNTFFKPVSWDIYDKFYIIHSDCSSCQMKTLLSRLRNRKVLMQSNEAVIFSVNGDASKLKAVIREYPVEIPIYIDICDEFRLLSAIYDNNSDPIEILKEDIYE